MKRIDRCSDFYKPTFTQDCIPAATCFSFPSRFQERKPIKLLAYLVLILGAIFSSSASANSFGDSFREWVLGSNAEAASNGMEFIQLDAITRGCVSCHNGEKGASHIALKSADTPLQITGSLSVNHPVGMDYSASAHREPYSYQSGDSLDPRILLVDGKVGCISCHQLRAGELQKLASVQMNYSRCSASGQLTVGPRETDLCLSCHLQ
ncbi:hypothetical protein [Thiolapillus sp.]